MWFEKFNKQEEAGDDGAASGGTGGGDNSSSDTGESTNSADADAVAAAIGDAGEAPKGWEFAEGVAGEGDAPEWFKADKYKSVSEQAKAYTELEGKFGSFTGAPEEYAITLSDELTEMGVELGADDPIMEKAMEFAKNSGMNQDGFSEMVNLYAMTEVAKQTAEAEAKTEEIKSLGVNGQQRLNNLEAWGKANMSEEQYSGFEEMIQTSGSVQAVERLIAMTRSAPVSPEGVQQSSGASSEEVRAMQFEKDEHGNRRIQTDPDFKARYDRMKGEVWGNEEHRVII